MAPKHASTSLVLKGCRDLNDEYSTRRYLTKRGKCEENNYSDWTISWQYMNPIAFTLTFSKVNEFNGQLMGKLGLLGQK